MQKQNDSNPFSSALVGMLAGLMTISMLVLPVVAAYQSGYVILPICLIAWLPSIFILKFLAYVLDIPFADWEKHLLAFIPFTLLTSSLLQNSNLLLLISCFSLACIYLAPTEPPSAKSEPAPLTMWLIIYSISHLAFNPFLASVCALSHYECLATIVLYSTILVIAGHQKPKGPTINNVSPSEKPKEPTTNNAPPSEEPQIKLLSENPLPSSSYQSSPVETTIKTPEHPDPTDDELTKRFNALISVPKNPVVHP